MSTLIPTNLINVMDKKFYQNKQLVFGTIIFALLMFGNNASAQKLFMKTVGTQKTDQGQTFCLGSCDINSLKVYDESENIISPSGGGWAVVNAGDVIKLGGLSYAYTQALTPNITVPISPGSTSFHYFIFSTGGKPIPGNYDCEFCWVDSRCEFYEALEIEHVQNISSGDIATAGGFNVCVPDPNVDVLKVKIKSGKLYSNCKLYLRIENEAGTLLHNVYLGNTITTYALSYKELFGNTNRYGQNIYFRLTTDFNQSGGYGNDNLHSSVLDRKGKFVFFEQISGVSGRITAKRIACKPYVEFKVPYTSSTIKDANEYSYRALPPGKEETTIPIKFTDIKRSGNNIILRPDANSESFKQPGKYKFQVFQNTQDPNNTKKYNEIKCAYKDSLNLGTLPGSYNISASAKVLYTHGSVKYHIKKMD